MSILDTFVALSINTTGLNPQESEIIEVGAVKVESSEIEDKFSHLVSSSGPRSNLSGIPPETARAIDDTEFVILDVETTGLDAYSGDRICEIGAVKLHKDQEIDQFEALIDPGRPISQEAFDANQITPDMLKDAPSIERVLPDFLKFIDDCVIVAYNSDFDMSFLQSELKLSGYEALNNTVIDLMALAKRLMPQTGRTPLWKVARSLGIPAENLHRALPDAEVTLKVFLHFLSVLKADGAKTVEDITLALNPPSDFKRDVRRKSRLTGISYDDIKGAPHLSVVLDDLKLFADGLPIVSHNARFVMSFLDKYRFDCRFDQPFSDSLELSKALFPTVTDHRVPTLVQFFGLDSEGSKRALDNAEVTASIFMGLVDKLKDTEFEIVKKMLQMIAGTDSSLKEIFSESLNRSAKDVLSRAITTEGRRPDRKGNAEDLKVLFNIGGISTDRGSLEADPDLDPLDSEDVEEIFKEEGPLSQAIEGYERRDQQVEMSQAVADALNNSSFLAAESGTGTGKSMAYLIPAIFWAVSNGKRVVVSTNTKNLQEQLFYKDIPLLDRILDVPFRYCLLKGRSNYICLNRWYKALDRIESSFTDYERKAALPLILWAEETETGDIAENTAFQAWRFPTLWNKICSDGAFCKAQTCRFGRRCFATNIRREALRSHVVVVNHSLLFSDMVSENAVLSEYEDVIFDEAHNVEKVATQYLGRELDIWRVRNLCDRFYQKEKNETGTIVSLRDGLRTADLQDQELRAYDFKIDRIIEANASFRKTAQDIFKDMAQKIGDEKGTDTYTEKIRYKKAYNIFEALQEELDGFADSGYFLKSEISQLLNWLKELPGDSFPAQEELTQESEGRRAELNEILDDLDFLLKAEDEAFVYWLELPNKKDSFNVKMCSAPLDIASLLQEQLYEGLNTAIFTSATIAIRGKFKYFLERLGIEKMEEDRVKTFCVSSPFDYDRQTLVCIPSFLPSPKDSSLYQERTSQLLRDLFTKVKRGALVLFTSYGMLNKMYNDLKDPLDHEGVRLLGQGISGARSNITERFKEDKSSVLLGTDSFWEGIDVPGEALQILVLTRLPFAVPTEPIVEAHIEEFEKKGKDPFRYYSIPEAAIRFRQGFGRLIRNKDDKGVIVILDNRVIKTWYGRVFLDLLPTKYRVFDSQEDIVEKVCEWFV